MMRKGFFAAAFLAALLAFPLSIFAQQGGSYYVSAGGNNSNDGLSEVTSFQSLETAFLKAPTGAIKKITVLGVLNAANQPQSSYNIEGFRSVFVFNDSISGVTAQEILITGKPGAAGAERAVLSGAGSTADVVRVGKNVKIRFEHIEISGGESNGRAGRGIGINIEGNSGTQVTLGPGAVVRANQGVGIFIGGRGSCVLEGGEVRDNAYGGINVSTGASLTMESGAIANNTTPSNGAGVAIVTGGSFTMKGGSISGNATERVGGGVCVMGSGYKDSQGREISPGSFTKTGGAITGNTAKEGPDQDIYRERGAVVDIR